MSVRHDRRIAVGPEPRQQLCQRMNDLSVITPGLPCGAGIGSRRWRLLQPRHPHGPNIQPGAPENPARHQRIAAVVARPHQQDHRRLRRHVLPHGQCHLGHGRPGRRHQLAGAGFVQPARLQPPDGGQTQQGGRQGTQTGMDGRGDRMQFHDSDTRETPENPRRKTGRRFSFILTVCHRRQRPRPAAGRHEAPGHAVNAKTQSPCPERASTEEGASRQGPGAGHVRMTRGLG